MFNIILNKQMVRVSVFRLDCMRGKNQFPYRRRHEWAEACLKAEGDKQNQKHSGQHKAWIGTKNQSKGGDAYLARDDDEHPVRLSGLEIVVHFMITNSQVVGAGVCLLSVTQLACTKNLILLEQHLAVATAKEPQ